MALCKQGMHLLTGLSFTLFFSTALAAYRPPPGWRHSTGAAKLSYSTTQTKHAQARNSPANGIFAESEGYPSGFDSAVELLRFVTAYKAGIETVTDITPYSSLLRDVANDDGELTFYTFIDTWVGNGSATDILYMNNETGQCSLGQHSDGNGWLVDAKLVFWPSQAGNEKSSIDTRPRHVITLSSGNYGGIYDIGHITVHEGKAMHNGSYVKLESEADFRDVVHADVYQCQSGSNEVHRDAMLGYYAYQVEANDRAGHPELVDMVTDDMFLSLYMPHMYQVPVAKLDMERKLMWGEYNETYQQVEVGMPIYYISGDVFTDAQFGPGVWLNSSYPLRPVGTVIRAHNNTMLLSMNVTCLPENSTHYLPRFMMADSPEASARVQIIVDSAKRVGTMAANKPEVVGAPPLLLKLNEDPAALDVSFVGASNNSEALARHQKITRPSALLPVSPVGNVDLNDQDASRKSLMQDNELNQVQDGDMLCVVAQRRNGNVFDRTFDAPDLENGGRVLMQLAVTGHGWSATTDQCGEYCHAVYRFKFNGQPALNITEFREDCKDNPIGVEVPQYGTWDESRNGWCPGTVEPGLYVDVTKWMKSGVNHASVDLVVWSGTGQEYLSYTDYGGFALNDAAQLTIGLSLFVYDKAQTQAMLAQAPFTAAEAAVHHGSSNPSALKPPKFLDTLGAPVVLTEVSQEAHQQQPSVSSFLALPSAKDTQKGGRLHWKQKYRMGMVDTATTSFEDDDLPLRPSKGPASSLEMYSSASHHLKNHQAKISDIGRFNFQARAPWYLYNATDEGPPGRDANAERVNVFEGRLMQSNTRTIKVNIKPSQLPDAWSQVALHLRLSKPHGMEMDHWDRRGSMGLLIKEGTSAVKIQPSPPHEKADEWIVSAVA